MTCPICYEEMDMIEFQDTKESTETSFKLECGHAYHTKCIVTFLTRSESKCPCCNTRTTAEKKLDYEALKRKNLSQIKNTDTLKIIVKEHWEAKADLIKVLRQLREETREWAAKRAAELNVATYRNYFIQTVSSARAEAKRIARIMSPGHLETINSLETHHMNSWRADPLNIYLFGKSSRYSIYRVSNPRVSISYNHLCKKK
jgi:hypothetical protein